MSSPFKPAPTWGTDALEAFGSYPDLPPLPPNTASLFKRPAADGIHTRLRIDHDVTRLTPEARDGLLALVAGLLQAHAPEDADAA